MRQTARSQSTDWRCMLQCLPQVVILVAKGMRTIFLLTFHVRLLLIFSSHCLAGYWITNSDILCAYCYGKPLVYLSP